METYSGQISKSSGKESAFKIWLDREGKRRFFQQEGHHYSARSHRDKEIIDIIYKSLSPAQLQKYKDIEMSDHNSYENRAKRRYAQETRRRVMAAQDPHHEHQARTEHREELKRIVTTRPNPPAVNLPPLEPRVKPNPIYQHDLRLICDDYQEQVAFRYRGYPSDKILDEVFTFVGVSVSYVYKDVNQAAMLTIPCEISMVNFSLRDGIKQSTSIHLNVDPLLIIDIPLMSREDLIQLCRRARDHRAYYAMQENEEPSTTYRELQYAWRRFTETWSYNGNQRAVLLCEKEIYNQVTATLRILAKACGREEKEFYEKYVDSKILPIEHLGMALRDASAQKIPDDIMLDYFKKPVIPNSDVHYCSEYHRKLSQGNSKRWICQQARGAMSIHKLYYCLNYENLYGFSRHFNEEIHILCHSANEYESALLPKLNPDTFIEFPLRANTKRIIQTWALPGPQPEQPVDMRVWAPPDPHQGPPPRPGSGSESDASDYCIRGRFLKEDDDSYVMLDPTVGEERNIRWPSSSSSKAERSPIVNRRPSPKGSKRSKKTRPQEPKQDEGFVRNWARDPGAWRRAGTAPDLVPPVEQLPQQNAGSSGPPNPTNWGGASPQPYKKGTQPPAWPKTRYNGPKNGSNKPRQDPPSSRKVAPVTTKKLDVFDSDDDKRRRNNGRNSPTSQGFFPPLPSYESACPSRIGSRRPSPTGSRRSYAVNDSIARNLHDVLYSSDEDADREVDELCNGAGDMDLGAPPKGRRKLRPKPKPQPPVQAPIPQAWPTFRWRIVKDAEIRGQPLWCPKEGVAYNPFSE